MTNILMLANLPASVRNVYVRSSPGFIVSSLRYVRDILIAGWRRALAQDRYVADNCHPFRVL